MERGRSMKLSDMLFANALMGEGGGGGGGGGGGDFSTAEVTFKCSQYQYEVTLVAVTEEFGITINTTQVDTEHDYTVIVPLYKGIYAIDMGNLSNVDYEVMPILTGDIALDDELGIVVSGDGTITCAGLNA